jgi:hypothetical protein
MIVQLDAKRRLADHIVCHADTRGVSIIAPRRLQTSLDSGEFSEAVNDQHGRPTASIETFQL